MNRIFKSLIAVAFAVSALISCQSEQKEEVKETKVEESKETQEAPKEEMKEVSEVLNANLATEEQLKGLGLSEDVVASIVAARPFMTVNEFAGLLTEVENKEELYAKIFVPMNLNTTPEDDFKMIPGVGDRMAHEFEEYRPYVNMKQFRKEIGKYVDDAEIKRYESYVFVPAELNTTAEEDIKELPGVGKRIAHEIEEYRPYENIEQFRKELGKYVDDKELKRLERLVYLK